MRGILQAGGVANLAAAPVLAALLVSLPVPSRGAEEKIAAAVQPIAFSHRVHAGLGTKCLLCHPSALRESRAGLPSSSTCMACHEKLPAEGADLVRLFDFHRRGVAIPWVRYYVLAAGTFFHHRYHLEAGALCDDCHGKVEKKDTLAGQEPMSMAACVGCHLSAGAPSDCGFCHGHGVVPPGS